MFYSVSLSMLLRFFEVEPYIMLTKYAQILTLGPFKKYVRSKGGRTGCSKSVLKRAKGGDLPRVHIQPSYFCTGVLTPYPL